MDRFTSSYGATTPQLVKTICIVSVLFHILSRRLLPSYMDCHTISSSWQVGHSTLCSITHILRASCQLYYTNNLTVQLWIMPMNKWFIIKYRNNICLGCNNICFAQKHYGQCISITQRRYRRKARRRVTLINNSGLGFPLSPHSCSLGRRPRNSGSVFTRGQFWPSGIIVACVCVCVSVCPSIMTLSAW